MCKLDWVGEEFKDPWDDFIFLFLGILNGDSIVVLHI